MLGSIGTSTRVNRTILLVEDEPDDQWLIARAFQANGIRTPLQVVAGGAEAIAYLKGEGRFADRQKFPYPSLMLVDLKMPAGDGFLVLEYLHGKPEFQVVPTVVLTSSEDPDDIAKAYALGASSYHVKPNGFGELREQLRILYEYWMTCRVPSADRSGRRTPTCSAGKLGERFATRAGPGVRKAES